MHFCSLYLVNVHYICLEFGKNALFPDSYAYVGRRNDPLSSPLNLQWSRYSTNHFEEKYWWNIFKKGCSMQKGRIWGLGRKWCAIIETWYWPIFSVGLTENRLNYLPTKFEIDRTMGTHLNSILKFKIRFSQNGFLGDTPFLKRRVQLHYVFNFWCEVVLSD